MLRRIIKIDQEKCNGCGACAAACHEGAIGMVDGKAVLTREDYCDGLGDCLPACPLDAISFEEREAPAYDAAAVENAKKQKLPCGCPGTACRTMERTEVSTGGAVPSCLTNFPVQLKLVPVNAPYFRQANLLIAADCTAYAYGNFHRELMQGKVTLIGCPKLDAADYAEKLTEIFRENTVASVTVARMTVPCCGGLEQAVKQAVLRSGRDIPCTVKVISPDGKMIG